MATKPAKKQARGMKKSAPAARTGAAKAAPPRAKAPAARPAAAAAKPRPKAAAKTARRGVPERRKQKSLRLRDLSPAFTVGDLAASLRFYVDGLGFTVKHRWERDGKLLGAQLIAGLCEISIGQDDWAKGRDRAKGVGFRVYLETVQNLGELAVRIRANGYAADGPTKEPWGATTVTVTDPDGFKLTFHDPMD